MELTAVAERRPGEAYGEGSRTDGFSGGRTGRKGLGAGEQRQWKKSFPGEQKREARTKLRGVRQHQVTGRRRPRGAQHARLGGSPPRRAGQASGAGEGSTADGGRTRGKLPERARTGTQTQNCAFANLSFSLTPKTFYITETREKKRQGTSVIECASLVF